MNYPEIRLKPGKEKAVRLGHPWLFSGALGKEPQGLEPGIIVDVVDAQGGFLARGYYNPHSQIRVRLLTADAQQVIDDPWLRQRLQDALERRTLLRQPDTNAYRVVCHEADLLPGVIVDQYGDFVVFQIVTAGAERWRSAIIGWIQDTLRPQTVVERSDEEVRRKEGMPLRKELVAGQLPEGGVPISEGGIAYRVDVWGGHKTGFYLDQRVNRQWIQSYARGRDVLNCFSYTGGFSVSAMVGGAKSVLSVDESRPALELARQHMELNGFAACGAIDYVAADVFSYLRQLRQEGKQFDLIILDPPKMAAGGDAVQSACRGYKDLNLSALKLLRPGGLLATYSCSGLISRDLFQKVVFGAAIDARCEVQVLEFLSQAPDHPVLLTFPESLYLKGMLCRKL